MHIHMKKRFWRGAAVAAVLGAFGFVLSGAPVVYGGEADGVDAVEVLRQRISVNFENAGMEDVLARLESESGLKFSWQGERMPEGRVSMRLHNVRMDQALDLIFDGAQVSWEAGGSVVRVQSAGGEAGAVFARYLSDHLPRRLREDLTSSELDYIDNIRDPRDLTDAELRRIREMGLDRRDIEDAYYEQRDSDGLDRDRRNGLTTDRRDTRDRMIERRPSATQYQRAGDLARLIEGTITPGQWREREDPERLEEPEPEPELDPELDVEEEENH